MSYQDALIIAMKREEAANRMYIKLAEENISTPKAYELFTMLADEELKHKLAIESIYDTEIFQEN